MTNRYPAYKPSGVDFLDDIPDHWDLARLGRMGSFFKGSGGTKQDEVEGGVPCVRYGDLYTQHQFVIKHTRSGIAETSSHNYQPLRYGDVLFAGSGETTEEIGKSAVNLIEGRSFCGGDVIVLRPSVEVNARFLGYATDCHSSVYQKTCMGRGVTIMHIYGSELKNLLIPLPPLPEQRAIADYLDTETARIDTLISKKRRLIELLQERRAEVTRAGVTGQLVGDSPTAKSSVPWITTQTPKHWGGPKIGYVAVLGSGHTPSRSVPEWWVPQECTVPWITTGEVASLRSDRIEYIERTRECVSEIGLANSSAVVHPADTVVLSRTASVGYSGIMATDMATSQDFATWTCGPNLLPRFLLLCLRAMRPDLLGRLAMGSTHKTIYMPDIQSLAIPLPRITEQHQIINAVWKQLKRLGAVEDRITAQISLLRESRQALISAAVTGDLATPGLTTETPTVRPISP